MTQTNASSGPQAIHDFIRNVVPIRSLLRLPNASTGTIVVMTKLTGAFDPICVGREPIHQTDKAAWLAEVQAAAGQAEPVLAFVE